MPAFVVLALFVVQVPTDLDTPTRILWPAAGRRHQDFVQPADVVDVALAAGRLVVLDALGELSAWDVDRRALLWRRWVHFRGVRPLRLALSADGRRVAVSPRAPPTDVVRLIDAGTGEELGAFAYGAAAAFSGDGGTLGAVSGRWVKRWDVGSGKELPPLPPAPLDLGFVALSPDGRRAVATVPGESGFLFWDEALRTVEHVLRADRDWGLGRAAAFSADGARLAVADTLALAIWELADGRPAKVLQVELSARPPLRFLADARRLLVRSSVRSWAVLGGGEAEPIEVPPGPVELLTSSEDGAWLVRTAGSVVTLAPLERELPARERTLWSAWLPDGQVLLWRPDGRGETWQPDSMQAVPREGLPPGEVAGLSADGTRALLRQDGALVVRDLSARRELFRVPGLPKSGAAALSPDGRLLLAGMSGTELGLWDVDGARLRAGLSAEARVTATALSANGKTMAWGDLQGGLGIADARTGGEALRYGPRGRGITALALSDDGAYAVSGDAWGELRLWRDRPGVEPELLGRLRREITAVSVAPGGRWIAAASAAGEIRLVAPSDGAGVSARGLDGAPTQLSFAPDGRRLLANDPTQGPLVWRLPGD